MKIIYMKSMVFGNRSSASSMESRENGKDIYAVHIDCFDTTIFIGHKRAAFCIGLKSHFCVGFNPNFFVEADVGLE